MKLSNLEEKELNRYFEIYDFSKWLKNKTILITGSKGIIGTGLIKWILKSNKDLNTNTHIIASSRNANSIPEYIEDGDSIEYCKFGDELNYCNNKRIDYIIHTAAPTSNKVFKTNPVESLSAILDGTKQILEVAKSHSESNMIYLSSEEAYGTPNETSPILESYVGGVDSLKTRSCYPLGKKTAELLCISYYEEYGVNVRIIRPTVILGLWQPYDSIKVEAEILRCIVENKDLYMKSAGLTSKSVIYSLDAITAIFSVLFKGVAGEAYNATNPDTFSTVKDRAINSFNKFNKNISVHFPEEDISESLGYLPQRSLLEDIDKIKTLGWKTLTSMDEIYEIDIKRFNDKDIKN